MKSSFTSITGRSIAPIAAALLFVFGFAVGDAQAQFISKWLSVGELHHMYSEAGSTHENYGGDTHGLQWPGIRNNTDNVRGKGLWIAVKNFKDEEDRVWPVKTAHVGPRITGVGEAFPQELKMTSRFEPPVTVVDGFETFDKPIVNDEVKEQQKADRQIDNVVNYVTGITMERRAMQFSQEFHNNYHIIEYNFTNTGNTDDDSKEEVEQTLEGVYFFFMNRHAPNRGAGWAQASEQAWGRFTMNDAVWNGMEDAGVDFQRAGGDFRAQFSWLGNVPSEDRYNTVGGPLWDGQPSWLVPEADSLGRLGAAHMVGRVYLHADGQAYDASVPLDQRDDDPSQPSTMDKLWAGAEGTHLNDHLSETKNIYEYNEIITSGRARPTHAEMVDPDGNLNTQPGDPTLGEGSDGYMFVEAFGPYDMEPGESVRLVMAEAADGLSDQASLQIGKAYKSSEGDDELIIAFDANGDGKINDLTGSGIEEGDETMTKTAWVMTSRDSLFKTFNRARANFESGYNIPKAPLPPKNFTVQSLPDYIKLQWEPQSGGPAVTGWELWRASKRFDGNPVVEGAEYELVKTLDPGQTQYHDEDVIRGIEYYYYVQAVGEKNTDPTGKTPVDVPLKSSRYYTQTYDPAMLKRAPGESLEDIRIAPNPFNASSDERVGRFSGPGRIAFFNIPGQSTIKIYTEQGELVQTIEHTDGSGDDYWELNTSSNQQVVSGIYLAVITDNETGENAYRKFTIIR